MRRWTLRAFVGVVVLAAVGSVVALPRTGPPGHLAVLLMLAGMTAIVGSRPVKISPLRVQLTVSHPFIFCALGALGPPAAVIVSLCGVMGSIRLKRASLAPLRLFFNFGTQALSAACAGTVFHQLGGRPGAPLAEVLLPLTVATACFFVVNTVLVSVAIALEKNQKILDTWRNSLLWTGVSYMSGLTLAAVMLIVLNWAGAWGLALAIPPCWMLLAFYRSNKERLEEHQRRISEVESLNAALEDKVAERTRELETALLRIEDTNRELRSTNEELTRAGQAKSAFLANVSHELRTPLNAVIGFSDLLVDPAVGTLNAKQRELLADIKGSGEHLLNLINDILDLSKVEAGKMELHRTPVDISGLVQSSVAMVRVLADHKNLNLTVDCAPDVRLGVLDPGLFRSVLVNLLSNAVKFTPEGGGVRVTLVRRGTGMVVEVEDTGIGISEEDLERVFQPFYQADGSYSREYQGTGLGLALVQRMVAMHEGTVSVKSREGKGSLFACEFPNCLIREADASVSHEPDADPPPREDRPPTVARREATSGESTILVVEGDPLSLKLARNVLRSRGYRVIEAASGEEALERVREERPDLILMEIRLPGLSGIELARELKQDPSTTGITVVAFTAHTEELEEEQSRAIGFAGHIAKPIRLSQFAEQIEPFLEGKEDVA